MNSTKRRSTLCVALVAAGILAATAAAQTSPRGVAAHRRASVDTIQWAQAVYSGAYWGIYAGQQLGFFAKQKLNVNINIVPSSPAILAAAAGGSVQMFAVATDAAVLAIERGADVSLAAGIQRESALEFVGAPGIKSISEMKGAAIGATNLTASDALLARLILDKAGVTGYSIIAIGTFPNRAAALLSGQVKGAILTQPWTSQLELAGGKSFGSAAAAAGSNFMNINVVVAKSWAASHRSVVVRFLKAYSQADDWLYVPNHKAAALKLLEADPVSLSAAQAQVTYASFISSYKPGKTAKVLSPILTKKDVITGVRLARAENLPTASLDASVYWDPSYWNLTKPAPTKKP